jgi:membrane protein YdbS with pleckstrin-like domain
MKKREKIGVILIIVLVIILAVIILIGNFFYSPQNVILLSALLCIWFGFLLKKGQVPLLIFQFIPSIV